MGRKKARKGGAQQRGVNLTPGFTGAGASREAIGPWAKAGRWRWLSSWPVSGGLTRGGKMQQEQGLRVWLSGEDWPQVFGCHKDIDDICKTQGKVSFEDRKKRRGNRRAQQRGPRISCEAGGEPGTPLH